MSQPDPIPGERPVAPYARKRFRKLQKQRAAAGLVTYGRPLETYNGRDALQDAMEEAVDLWNYLCQMELERATEHARVELLQQENERLQSALQRAGKWRAEASRIRNEHAAGDTTHADQLRAAYEENAKLHRALNARNEEQEAERNVERVLTFCKQLTWDIARLTDSLAMIEDVLTPQEASTPPVVTPSVVTAVNIATKALVEQRVREAARDTAQELVDTDGCPRSAPARGRDVSGREGGR